MTYEEFLGFVLLTCHMIWNLLLIYHMRGMTTRTLAVPMLRFLLIFPFWHLSTVKRLTSSNQDIQAWPLMLTTIARTRVWVIIFHMYKYCVIWHLQVCFSCPSRIGVDSFSRLMDPRHLIHRFFPYDRNDFSLLRYFKHWVPSSSNPPPMIDDEKDEASTRCVYNPPMCKCGYHVELVNPLAGLDYTLFLRCPIPLTVIIDKRLYILLWSKHWVYVYIIDMCCILQSNKQGCHFNELIYGPRS
jgi:hypothetical protein